LLILLAARVSPGSPMKPVIPLTKASASAVAAVGPATSFAALRPGGNSWDNQLSLGYYYFTGEIWIDARGGQRLTSINLESEAGIFTGDPALNLGGVLDRDTDHNIFKATSEDSFGSITFGSVAERYLPYRLILNDLTVTGTLVDGTPVEDVDLIWIPEPNTLVLLGLGILGLLWKPRLASPCPAS
jgi:hypothetical protein